VSVDGPEREGEAEEEVGHRQVHQVDIRAASTFLHRANHIDEVVESFQVESLSGQQLGKNKVMRFKSSGGRRTGGRLSSWQ